jgi:hypothetical protein
MRLWDSMDADAYQRGPVYGLKNGWLSSAVSPSLPADALARSTAGINLCFANSTDIEIRSSALFVHETPLFGDLLAVAEPDRVVAVTNVWTNIFYVYPLVYSEHSDGEYPSSFGRPSAFVLPQNGRYYLTPSDIAAAEDVIVLAGCYGPALDSYVAIVQPSQEDSDEYHVTHQFELPSDALTREGCSELAVTAYRYNDSRVSGGDWRSGQFYGLFLQLYVAERVRRVWSLKLCPGGLE